VTFATPRTTTVTPGFPTTTTTTTSKAKG
jgi:hypothetical protein